MMAGIVAFAVPVIRHGWRRIRLFERGALALGQLEKEQPAAYHCTWFRVIARNHFRMEQLEAILAGSSMKLLSAVQSRSVSSSEVRAM